MKSIEVTLKYMIHTPDDFDIEQLTQSATLATEGLWMVTGLRDDVSITMPVRHRIRVVKEKPDKPAPMPKKGTAAYNKYMSARAIPGWKFDPKRGFVTVGRSK